MKRFSSLLLISVFFAGISMSFISSNSGERASYSVDIKESKIGWTGYKVTGKHTGNISLKSGTLTFEGAKLVGGNFDIDMNSITCTDMQGEYGDKLVGHLKSDDFFGVANHPVARFSMTNVIYQGTQGSYKILGDLTIKGITKPIKFFAKVVQNQGAGYTSSAKIVVDRSEYDVRFGSGSFFDSLGDKTIYDEFDLEVNLVTSTK